MLRFADPEFLILFLALAVLGWWYFFKRKKKDAAVFYSDTSFLQNLKSSSRTVERKWIMFLRIVALSLLVLALARPQSGKKDSEVTTEGIDIILTLDISGSMRAEDFKPRNRLYVAKEVIKDFVADRPDDRIGLVVFSKQSFTQCPLTLDHQVLLSFLNQVDFGMIEDGTAIGLAIANSANRLKNSAAKSKVIILLTDGINNSGEIDPLTAANLASQLGIKIYTVGVGKPGEALYPVEDPIYGKKYVYLPNEVDEKTLQEVAQITNGEYFRAKDEGMLKSIYKQISSLERSKIKVKEYTQYDDLFARFTLLGLAALILEVFLLNIRYKKLP